MLNDKEIGMEKTPKYFDCSPNVEKRIKETVPGIKILLVVCDPTRRAFSDFIHQVDCVQNAFVDIKRNTNFSFHIYVFILIKRLIFY